MNKLRAVALAFLGLSFYSITSAASTEVCKRCHDEKYVPSLTHSPIRRAECELCHTAEKKHIVGGDRRAVKTNRTTAACYQCHDSEEHAAVVHLPIADSKNCSNCHDPHGTTHPSLLKKPVKNLCLGCHQTVPTDGQSRHSVINSEESCLECHNAHSSTNAKLLVKREEELCLSCHDTLRSRLQVGASPHTADRNSCVKCHSPHATANHWLLKKSFPRDSHAPFSEASYQACFSCHKEGLVSDIAATNFRTARLNLHEVHMTNRGRTTGPAWGRSCRACHDPHVSEQPFSIVREVGPMRVPMSFVKVASGGRCAGACHSEKTYDPAK